MSETLIQIIEAFREWARRLTEALQDGRISLNSWYEGMERIITRAHIAAMIEGLGMDVIPDNLMPVIRNNVQYQLDYLENFKDTIESSPEFKNGWIYRAESYGASSKVSYWEGKVVEMVGRVLPLPAMPAVGTQCLNSCLCSWRIVELDKEAGDYDAFWERHAKDSCQTCIQRAADWYPARIRGMILQI